MNIKRYLRSIKWKTLGVEMGECVCIHAYIFIEVSARRHKLLAVITIYLKFKICKGNTLFHLQIHTYTASRKHARNWDIIIQVYWKKWNEIGEAPKRIFKCILMSYFIKNVSVMFFRNIWRGEKNKKTHLTVHLLTLIKIS